MATARAFVVALVGAESTGKTELSQALGEMLGRLGRRVAVVPEHLREFCDRHGRTPYRHEQSAIAGVQSQRIEQAAQGHDLVIADTTALMTAVYSDLVYADASLYESALRDHGRADLTLLTGLDLPWRADGLQRDGPHVRLAVDERVRAALDGAAIAYSVVFGLGPARWHAALSSVERALRPPPPRRSRWQWHCDRCGDAGCERHALPR